MYDFWVAVLSLSDAPLVKLSWNRESLGWAKRKYRIMNAFAKCIKELDRSLPLAVHNLLAEGMHRKGWLIFSHESSRGPISVGMF